MIRYDTILFYGDTVVGMGAWNPETWNLELWNVGTASHFQIVFVFNNTQVERSVRNFKEPATDKTETDQALVPETVGEHLPF